MSSKCHKLARLCFNNKSTYPRFNSIVNQKNAVLPCCEQRRGLSLQPNRLNNYGGEVDSYLDSNRSRQQNNNEHSSPSSSAVVFLKNTPRAAIVRRTSKSPQPTSPEHDNTTPENLPSSPSSTNTSDKQSSIVFLRNTPRALFRKTQTTPNPEPEPNHSPTHFLKGGTPCDPAPPPFHLAMYGEESLYTLVLLRHGESVWNKENRYTGWCDVDLTQRGLTEARDAGRLLLENKIEVDHCFTSVLKRAGVTANLALTESGQHWVPVTKSWRLNERHYGALQGYNKDTAYRELGIDQELVMEMRRSYDTRPPEMSDDHTHWHGADRRYKTLTQELLDKTRAESLKDTAHRILPFYKKVVLPAMTSGNKCLIVSHANTIRTLIKHIDNISDEDIKGMSIPTGVPLLYRLDKNFKPVDPDIELEFRYLVEPKGYTWATSRAHGFHGVYLGDLSRLQDIQKKRDMTSRDWQRIILRNVAKKLLNENYECDTHHNPNHRHQVMEIRQLWWQIHAKIASKTDFSNMILLQRMKDHLEKLMVTQGRRKQRYITMDRFERIIDKIHLDMEGKVVEPFVELKERDDRRCREKKWYEMMALDLEEEALIR